MKRRACLLTAGVLGGTCLAGPVLAAGQRRALSLRQLLDASDEVVAGVLQEPRSAWVHVFGERRIVTSWDCDVASNLSGTGARRLRVATLGGTVGDVVQWVPHEAPLRARRQYLLFLCSGPLERHWVTGMAQGAFELAAGPSQWSVRVSPLQWEYDGDDSAVRILDGLTLGQVKRAMAGAS